MSENVCIVRWCNLIDVSIFKPSIHHCVHETWKVYPSSPYCILYRETHWVLFPSSRSIVFAHSRLRRTAGLEKGSVICPHSRKGVSALKTAWDISQWKKKTRFWFQTSSYVLYMYESDYDFRSGCRNVSHHYRQQSFSGLHSPGRSNYTTTTD